MRKLVILTCLAVAGCTTPSSPAMPGERPGPVAPNPAGGTCVADGGNAYVGQPATVPNGEAILAATHAKSLRWVFPGMMMTMEFSAERVNVRYGPDNRILSVNCG
jgi:hypothetical protein